MYQRVLNKRTIDDYVEVVLSRHRDMPYDLVIETFEITPFKFMRAVKLFTKVLTEEPEEEFERDVLRLLSDNPQLDYLTELLRDEEKVIELFKMPKEYIKAQYDEKAKGRGTSNEKRTTLYPGTLLHPYNRATLTYHALSTHHSELVSKDRETVIGGIKNLVRNICGKLTEYLAREIGLSGLMATGIERRERKEIGGGIRKNSPYDIFRWFDQGYMEETGEVSLFDLEQEHHLHYWEEGMRPPFGYWKTEDNVQRAVVHILTEQYPDLKGDREQIIRKIKSLPRRLSEHFIEIGLRRIMLTAFKGRGKFNSPREILEVFDNWYRQETGDVSLFDQSQKYHLSFENRRLVKE